MRIVLVCQPGGVGDVEMARNCNVREFVGNGARLLEPQGTRGGPWWEVRCLHL
jgi:hypothetical protein